MTAGRDRDDFYIDQPADLRRRGRHGLPRAQPAVRDSGRHQLRLHHLPGGGRVRGGDPGHAAARRRTAGSRPTSAGWNLPFPLPWIGAAVVGGVIALPFTFLVGRRLRGDFAAVGLLVTAVLLNLLVTNYRPLLNGDAGLSLIPQPLQGQYNPAVGRATSGGSPAVAIVLCAGRLPVRAPHHRVAVRPLAARDARQRPGGRLARQEPAVDADRDARRRRGDRRPVRRGAGLLHHHLVAGGLGVRRDGRAVRGGDHRRRGQPRWARCSGRSWCRWVSRR